MYKYIYICISIKSTIHEFLETLIFTMGLLPCANNSEMSPQSWLGRSISELFWIGSGHPRLAFRCFTKAPTSAHHWRWSCRWWAAHNSRSHRIVPGQHQLRATQDVCWKPYAMSNWRFAMSTWRFPSMGVPPNGWLIVEEPIKMEKSIGNLRFKKVVS